MSEYKNVKEELNKKSHSFTKKKAPSNTIINNQHSHLGGSLILKNFKNIKSEDDCTNMMQLIIQNSYNNRTEKIKEIHSYLMECLDEAYYEPFHEWVRLLWACKNTDPMLYPFFLNWSAQSKDFSWTDTINIEKIYDMWDSAKNKGLTEGSIRHWSRLCNSSQYEMIRNNSTNNYIENTLEGKGSDHDIAKLIHHIYYDKYRCVGIKSNLWFAFNNHRWMESECGTDLRDKYSNVIAQLFIQKQSEIMDKIRSDDNMSPETQDTLTTQAAIYNKISMRLKDATHKNHILTE